jgi:hypothetical protein
MRYELKRLSRKRLEAGELPGAIDGKIVGGPSEGATCGLCDEPIVRGSPEIEVWWIASTVHRKLTMHAECYSAWSLTVRGRI